MRRGLGDPQVATHLQQLLLWIFQDLYVDTKDGPRFSRTSRVVKLAAGAAQSQGNSELQLDTAAATATPAMDRTEAICMME